jgi:hypothetical protein
MLLKQLVDLFAYDVELVSVRRRWTNNCVCHGLVYEHVSSYSQ